MKIQEHNGIIIRIESYFENDDRTPRIRLDFIDPGTKDIIKFEASTSDIESMIYFINDEVEKANGREYIP